MITRAASRRCAFGQQPVKSGDADVIQPVDVVAHHLGGDTRPPRPLVCQRFPLPRQESALARADFGAPLDDSGLVRGNTRRARAWLRQRRSASASVRVTSRLCPRRRWPRRSAAICSASCPGRRRLPETPGGRAMVVDPGETEVFDGAARRCVPRPALGSSRHRASPARTASNSVAAAGRSMRRLRRFGKCFV